jgi:hypothetical protein
MIAKNVVQGVFRSLLADPTTLDGACESIHAGFISIQFSSSFSFFSFSFFLESHVGRVKSYTNPSFIFSFDSSSLLLIVIILFVLIISN